MCGLSRAVATDNNNDDLVELSADDLEAQLRAETGLN